MSRKGKCFVKQCKTKVFQNNVLNMLPYLFVNGPGKQVKSGLLKDIFSYMSRTVNNSLTFVEQNVFYKQDPLFDIKKIETGPSNYGPGGL